MDWLWRVELLGRLSATRPGQSVRRFRTTQAGTLLGYLSYFSDRLHTREELAELLWPEAAPEAGRLRLRVVLTSLRRQLEPPGTGFGSVLVADRATVGLRAGSFTTDVAEFTALLDAAKRAESPPLRARFLADAARVYGGELLPGRFDEWIIGERRHLADLHYRTLRDLARYWRDCGEWERAVEYARRALNEDRLREDTWHDLIAIYAASGRRRQALDLGRELERVLKTELDAQPSRATRQLIDGLRGAAPPMIRAEGCRDEPKPGQVTGSTAASPSTLEADGVVRGTVTLLMVENPAGDTVGSPPEQRPSLSAAIREQILDHGGSLLPGHETPLVALFDRALPALGCALDITHAGSDSIPTNRAGNPVRIALHAGAAESGQHPGEVLHYALRIFEAGHPAQILCSEVAAALLKRGLDPAVALRDLGAYRLAAGEEPERIFQVERVSSAPSTFPPLRAPSACPGSLPGALNRFFGREEELTRLASLLVTDARHGNAGHGPRLVTLTGPGGSGKTRLALEFGRRMSTQFAGGVWFVSLAAVADPRLIPRRILATLLPAAEERPDPMEHVEALLRTEPTLLILDNLEQLVQGGAPILHRLLERVPTLRCLVTSRCLLGVSGEHELPLTTLPVPPACESAAGADADSARRAGSPRPLELLASPSVALLVDRAQACRSDFQITERNAEDIAELCTRLEGIPLAIELAAARIWVATPRQMIGHLERRFDFLVGARRDLSERHRSLRAAFDWSLALLQPEDQRFFARLSVFRGGWTLEAAARVAGNPGHALGALERLRDASLIGSGKSEGAEARFTMLETLREYAADHLSPDEHQEAQRAHAEYFAELAREVDAAFGKAGQRAQFDRLERDHDNVRAALAWAEAGGSVELGLRLVVSLVRFWHARGHGREGRSHLARLLEAPAPASAEVAALKARARYGLGFLALQHAEYTEAREQFLRSLALRREANSAAGIAEALTGLSMVAVEMGDHDAVRLLNQEARSIRRAIGDQAGEVSNIQQLAHLARLTHDYDTAHQLYAEALALHRSGGKVQAQAYDLHNLALVEYLRGNLSAAGDFYRESLKLCQAEGLTGKSGDVLLGLARLARSHGESDEAREKARAALAVYEELGSRRELTLALLFLGVLEATCGRLEAARGMLCDASDRAHSIGLQMVEVWAICMLGQIAGDAGDAPTAHDLTRRGAALARSCGDAPRLGELTEDLAEFCAARGNVPAATRLLAAAATFRLPAAQSPLDAEMRRPALVAAIRHALNDAEFDANWQSGRATPWETVLEESLPPPADPVAK